MALRGRRRRVAALSRDSLSFGSAAFDYDRDGAPDLFVATGHVLGRNVTPCAMQPKLFRNDTQTGWHFLGLDLRSLHRIPPVGGRVVVHSGKNRRVMPVFSGGRYLSSSDGRLLFGLTDDPGPVAVEIYWPSGRVDKFARREVDCYWIVYEGEPPVRLSRFLAGYGS